MKDEFEAIKRLKQGDISGLEFLVSQYQVRAVRAAYLITRDSALAEDVAQDCFVRVYHSIHGFDSSRPFEPWFMRSVVNASVTDAGDALPPTPSNITTLHGFTFQLDNVVELEDGFVFTGNLSWDDSAFPSGKGMVTEPLIPALIDADGQRIPIEEVRLDAAYDEHTVPWSYRTNRKAFSGPITLSIPSIKTNIVAQPVDFEIDFGSNPQVGQSAEVNRDFVVEGHTIRLLSVYLVPAPDSCQGMVVDFNFSTDAPGISANVNDSVPFEPMVCSGGGGGGGGPMDPTAFTIGVNYKEMPTGIRRFSFEFWIPYEVSGPWQAQWNPPLSSEPIPTPQAGACLTLEKWNQLISQDDTLHLRNVFAESGGWHG